MIYVKALSIAVLTIGVFVGSLNFGMREGVFGNGSGTINILPGFVSTTSPNVGVTQRILNTPVVLSGYVSIPCLGTDALGVLGSGTCSGGSGVPELPGGATTTVVRFINGLISTASSTIHKLNSTYASTSQLTVGSDYLTDFSTGFSISGAGVVTLDTSGTWLGNAVTATGLAANGSNCSAGSAAGGVSATGVSEDCTDYWTEAENTSAAYTPGSRTITIAGTANQVSSSAGAQDLSANRTWTLSLPNHVIFPSSFVTTFSSSTNGTTTFAGLSNIYAIGSNGLDFHSNNGTPVADFGGGGGSNASFFGGVNIDGTTRLATSLSGILLATAGTVSVATPGTDYANFAYPFVGTSIGFSTSTIGINTAGLISVASSSLAFLDSVRATSTNFVSTNATTSVLSASSHLRSQGTLRVDNLTSAIVLTGATGLAAEYTGAACTNQVIEDLDAVGSPTCRTITSAYVDSTISTFGYPFTPATNWNATSTLTLNTGGFMSNASTSLHILRNTYASSTYASFGTASTSALVVSGIGSATNNIMTVSATGAVSASSLTALGAATFGYPYTPATSWFSTSTIYLNTAGIMSNASSTFHILRSGYFSNTFASSTYSSFGTASTSALIISGTGGNGTRCLQVDSFGSVSANASACGTGGGGADYNKWATSTGSMLGINPLTALFVGIGTSTPRSLLHLATSTAPQITISDGFASYDSWNFRTVGGTFFLATSSMATNATSSLSVLTIGSDGVVNFGNRIDTCIALTGSADLCDGVDSGGAGGTSAASKWATTTGSSLLSITTAGALRIGVGTSSPWGVFSANSNSRPQLMLSDTNLTTNMKHWVASTTPLGRLVWGIMNDGFTAITSSITFGTSTIDYAGYPAGVVVATSTTGAYFGAGTSTDQFFVDGRINTGDWHFDDCKSTGSRTAQVNTDLTGSVISTTLGQPCPGWAFVEDTAGVLDETVMNGYSYFRLRAGNVGTFNSVAGEGFGIQHTTSFMNFASNTPKLSTAVRLGAIQNATTSLIMIGYGSMTGVASDHAAIPTYYAGVVSSTTESNYIAVIRNGNTWQYKNTGIASSSVLVGETAWGTWDVEVSSTTAIFRYRGTNGIATTTNVLVTGGAGGTEAWIPTHNGLRVTPIVSIGKPTIGLQHELHIRWIRLWRRDLPQ